jgi:NADH:ubiquinone oxidoreductase subunit 5 (subunit L)/multisubunit Na+/H+ antiporter MnhA subunit
MIEFFTLICLFTSFYAGLNSCIEPDLKKLVALSTLSHLGFIGLAFSSG